MTQTMRRVAVTGLNSIETQTVPRPSPGPGEVLVATRLAGICGSDTHAAQGLHPLLHPPYVPGHEVVGEVARLGPDVAGPPLGTRVIVKPNVTCGRCVNCQADRSNACQQLEWIGCDSTGLRPGGMAEFVIAPAGNLFAVPESVSDEAAVLVECLATPVHAARIAGDLAGAKVAVLGAGTIGLFAVIAARQAGAERIVVSDLDGAKRERALRHGAHAAVDPTAIAPTRIAPAADHLSETAARELDGPADVVFDCVAIESTIRQGLRLLRKAGTLLAVGVPQGDVAVPMALVQDSEIRIQGCANYTDADISAALALAAAGRLPAGEIIAGTYRIEDGAEAFARAEQTDAGKVIIDPRLR